MWNSNHELNCVLFSAPIFFFFIKRSLKRSLKWTQIALYRLFLVVLGLVPHHQPRPREAEPARNLCIMTREKGIL